MSELDLSNGTRLVDLGKINVILGKNGSGKSSALRRVDEILSGKAGCIRYITPERGGELAYDGNVDTQRSSDATWLTQTRRRNRWEQFRQSSVAEFRSLETLVLRSIESDRAIRDTDFSFETEIMRINEVLDRVRVARSEGAGLDIYRKEGNVKAQPSDLSSGESELISLSVEILSFSYLCKLPRYNSQSNWLLLDEPDVHLHPDLQHRLMHLLVRSLEGVNASVIIATHSTSILASLTSLSQEVRVGLKQFGPSTLVFRSVDDPMRSVLPMFGAHPLSNVFNDSPPLIVEGEDDERIWQQAVRSSGGRLSIFPCVAGNIQSMNRYEIAANEVIGSVYDNAVAYSLRDRDDDAYLIDDIGSVIRMRLNCRNAENLIVTDDVLSLLGTNWTNLVASLEEWIAKNPSHPKHADVAAFQRSGWDRRDFQLKGIRNLLVWECGSSKPWEVAVGQAIASLKKGNNYGNDSLVSYLGPKLVEKLNLLN